MNRGNVAIYFDNEHIHTSPFCEYFSFEKDRYTPYTKAEGKFRWPYDETDFSSAKMIRFYINGNLVHEGLPDRISVSENSSGRFLRFSSRGFTLLLGQNEPCPGINSDVSLQDLITKNISDDRIEYENPTDKINYIYVKEKSTVWDAVCAYGIKSKGIYPYIKGTNTVNISLSENTADYSGIRLLEKGSQLDTTLLISEIFMADLNGDYTCHEKNSTAETMHIQRTKYYPLDRQWLYSPETGLKSKLQFSQRKMNVLTAVYQGFCNEDLTDRITNLFDEINGRRICSVKVTGSSKGIFTHLKAEVSEDEM